MYSSFESYQGHTGFYGAFLSADQAIGKMSRVFANGPGGRGSIPKTQKMGLDASLLSTQNYKIRIKGKVEQSNKKSSVLPHTST